MRFARRWRPDMNRQHVSQDLNLVFRKYGKQNQLLKFCEESGELIQAINKYEGGRGPIDAIYEELADTQLMLDQIKEMYTAEEKDLDSRYMEKLHRVLQIINEGN